jgi:hypothetical protein
MTKAVGFIKISNNGLIGGLAANVANVQERIWALPLPALPEDDIAAAIVEVARLKTGGAT